MTDAVSAEVMGRLVPANLETTLHIIEMMVCNVSVLSDESKI